MNGPTLEHLRTRFGITDEHGTPVHAEPHKMVFAADKIADPARREQPGSSPSVVIVYNDMHAALRAAEAVERLACKFRNQGRQWLLPVPVAQLHDPNRFDRLLSDANSADMIIVSFNGLGDFPLPLKKWIEDCLKQQREGHAAVVALLSSNEELDAPDSPRYQFFKNAAWAAGLAFVSPRPDAKEEPPRVRRRKAVD
jgi:hypothetical protein